MRAKIRTPIIPIILAAGSSAELPFPKPLARFGRRTALDIAIQNCMWLERPVVVLGCDAALVWPAVRGKVRIVFNREWRKGQLGSLLRGLRFVPPGGAFLIYPVDHPLVDASLVRRLATEYRAREEHQLIVMPMYRGEPGHPAIVSMDLLEEFRRAKTAREVIYRDMSRVRIVKVRSRAVSMDFHDLASYAACLRAFQARSRQARALR